MQTEGRKLFMSVEPALIQFQVLQICKYACYIKVCRKSDVYIINILKYQVYTTLPLTIITPNTINTPTDRDTVINSPPSWQRHQPCSRTLQMHLQMNLLQKRGPWGTRQQRRQWNRALFSDSVNHKRSVPEKFCESCPPTYTFVEVDSFVLCNTTVGSPLSEHIGTRGGLDNWNVPINETILFAYKVHYFPFNAQQNIHEYHSAGGLDN